MILHILLDIVSRSSSNLPYEKVGKNEPVCIADEVPFEIPESWEWVRLGTLVYNHGQKKPESTFSYIDIGSIDNANQKLSSDENLIEADKAPSRARKIVETGDIIYSTVRPYLHNMCIINKDFSFEPIASTGFAVMTSHADFVNEFLFLYMMSPDFDAYANDTDNSKGVAYPAINDERLYRAFIPVPPVSEQKRIIEKYTSLKPFISKYENAEEKLTSLNGSFPEQLKKSILQEAVMGKLVPQDKNDEPASVLLERIRKEKKRLIAEGKLRVDKHESIIYRRDNSHYEKLNGVERCIDDEIPFEIPDNWAWARLSSIVSILGDGIHGTPTYNQQGTVYFINGNNLCNGQIVIKDDTKRVSEEEASKHRRELSADTVLTSINGTIGNVAFYSGENVILGKSACYFNLLHGIEKEYIKLLLETDYYLKYSSKVATGTTIKNVSLKGMRELLVPIPTYVEQERIVEKINTLTEILIKL